jgi:hypothetical protein
MQNNMMVMNDEQDECRKKQDIQLFLTLLFQHLLEQPDQNN